MKVKVNAEIHNGAYQGNTKTDVIEIDDEDVEDCTDKERDEIIAAQVEEHVLSSMVGWDWLASSPPTDGDYRD